MLPSLRVRTDIGAYVKSSARTNSGCSSPIQPTGFLTRADRALCGRVKTEESVPGENENSSAAPVSSSNASTSALTSKKSTGRFFVTPLLRHSGTGCRRRRASVLPSMLPDACRNLRPDSNRRTRSCWRRRFSRRATIKSGPQRNAHGCQVGGNRIAEHQWRRVGEQLLLQHWVDETKGDRLEIAAIDEGAQQPIRAHAILHERFESLARFARPTSSTRS